MLAKDIMTSPIELVNRRTTLQDAARKMASLGIGALPVADRSTLVGMITDRDIAVRGVAAGLDCTTAVVGDAMTPNVIECREDEALSHVVDLMERHGLRRVVVVNQKAKPIGIISLEDLARRAADKQLAAEALHKMPNGKALAVVAAATGQPSA